MKMFYRGVSFGLRALIFVTPKAADLLVEEGFKSKETLFQRLRENTFSEDKAKSEPFNMELDIIVVGAAIQACQLGNLHYDTTGSIDPWR